MNKKELYNRIRQLKTIGLSGAEKSAMLGAVTGAPASSPYVRSTWRVFARFSSYSYVAALALIVLLSGGSLIYASEKAVPGDTLYAVKTKFTEPVRDALARTPEAKAAWEAEKASRRLEEAEQLAIRRELNEPKRAELEAKFEVHTRTFDENLSKLSAATSTEGKDKAKEAKRQFDAAVSLHDKVLDDLEKEVPEPEKKELKQFRAAVFEKVKEREKKEEERNSPKGADDREGGKGEDDERREVPKPSIRLRE